VGDVSAIWRVLVKCVGERFCALHCLSVIALQTGSYLMVSHICVGGEGNLHPREYLSKYTSRGKPKIPSADRILMDPGHKARKNPSDNADLGFQAVGPALRIIQLNVEGFSAAKRCIFMHMRRRRHICVI